MAGGIDHGVGVSRDVRHNVAEHRRSHCIGTAARGDGEEAKKARAVLWSAVEVDVRLAPCKWVGATGVCCTDSLWPGAGDATQRRMGDGEDGVGVVDGVEVVVGGKW